MNKIKVTDVNSNTYDVPEFNVLASVQADTDSLHGDGFFPVCQDQMAKVTAGIGLQVKIADYLALVDGYKLYVRGKKAMQWDQYTYLEVLPSFVGIGDFYLMLKPQVLSSIDIDGDGSQETTVYKNGAGYFYFDFIVPEEGAIGVAKLNIPADTTQLTDDMIDNSVKVFLHNVQVLADRVSQLEDQPQVPSDILELLQDHEDRIAYLEEHGGGTPGPNFINHSIVEEDFDISSTYDVDQLGNFTLPINEEAQIVVQDTCDVDGDLDPTKWTVLTAPASYSNGQLVMGAFAKIKTVKTTTNFDLKFDAKHFATGNTSPGQAVSVLFRNDGSGNFYRVNFYTQGTLGGAYIYLMKYANSIQIASTYVAYSEPMVEGEMVPLEVKVENNNIQVYVKGVQKFNFTDNNWGGVPAIITESNIIVDCFNNAQYLDYINCTHVGLGTVYELSGLILTNQIESTVPINQAFLQGNVEVPANTTVQYEISLNGGLNWVSVNLNDIVNGTIPPWNGVGDNYLVKVTMNTTDTSVTPKIVALNAISQL